ncbi:leucine-rich repeat-containing protein [Plakobranchus ocellatus]|uniref:Leucine-rich repeat-containing protein n=1 Tax=Plakobranchus ocellatus TaxID=259542 RepID=A0AAV3YBR5_9GAST|nr:leucine-rich repeat-containing protein [Plakobranchus ocellatus]
MAGKEVAKVVNRCEEAKESCHLDLSGCDLFQIPDAVFLLMRSTELQTCNLSQNLIKRIPSKLSAKFSALRELDLSTNHLSSLPEELRHLEDLKKLDISHNHFKELPQVIYRIESLRTLAVEGNEITDVDVQRLKGLANISEVNLQDNPISPATHSQLLEVKHITVLLTPQDPELDAVD